MPKPPPVLFHVTFETHLPSIMRWGLRPNRRPNRWLSGGLEKSRRGVWLCQEKAVEYWWDTLAEYIWEPNLGDFRLLAVDSRGLKLTPCDEDQEFAPDWVCSGAIEPGRLTHWASDMLTEHGVMAYFYALGRGGEGGVIRRRAERGAKRLGMNVENCLRQARNVVRWD